jgi:hypothetical protein
VDATDSEFSTRAESAKDKLGESAGDGKDAESRVGGLLAGARTVGGGVGDSVGDVVGAEVGS